MNSMIQENKETLSGAISNTFSIEIEEFISFPIDEIEISCVDIKPMTGLFRLIDGQLTRVVEDYPPVISGGFLKLIGLSKHGDNT